jgi:hypothetical protein
MVVLMLGGHTVCRAGNRVFLLCGQSNMVGQGSNSELSAPYSATQTDVNFWKNGWVSLAPGFGNNSSMFGPEVSFGRAIKDAYPSDGLYLIKYAVNGTALYNDWAPPPTSGPQYTCPPEKPHLPLRMIRTAHFRPAFASRVGKFRG